MKPLFTFLALILLQPFLFAGTEEKKLEQLLFELPDLSFSKISKPEDPYLKYMLKIKQPLDHQDASKGYLYQRVVLTHHGFDRPAVMSTQGYELNYAKNELELSLNANHLNIEHRFFGESSPDSLQWKYLTLEQATADLHRINQLFRNLYRSKWISTGISKGGQTTIFYRYFYPNDVDVSVPYVAPVNQGLEDKRIYTFLDTVGKKECRSHIFEFQKFMLEHEAEALEKIKWYSKGAKLTFRYLSDSLAKAYELSVLEFSFSFWQWGSKCEDIPALHSLDTCLDFLMQVSNIGFFSDAGMSNYGPHYYQAATQMGYYGYDIAPFKKYIQHFNTNPLASFAPEKSNPPPYSNALNLKLDKWLRESGNNMLYVYGGSDTWSATRVIPSEKVNSKAFLVPGKDHGKARIKNMKPDMQQQVSQLLQQWLGVTPDFSTLNK